MIPFSIVLDRFMSSRFHPLYSIFAKIAYKVFSICNNVAMFHAIARIALTKYILFVPP